MNFAQLKFVKATASLQSFTKAADFCHVTQPTLSNGISKLEEQLGGKLFERTTRTVRLTSFGETMLPTVTSILNLEEMLYLQANDFANPDIRVFKIGMSPLLNTKFVALLTNSYKDQNSGIEIVLMEDSLIDLEDKLKNKELDVIFVPITNKKTYKNSMPLYEEELFFVSNQNSSEQVQVKDIRDNTFVMVPDACGLSEITRTLLRSTRNEVKEYEGKALSCQVLADWASNGLGSAILPKSKLESHISRHQVYSASKPSKIVFQARWQADNNESLNKMLQYFKKNISGIAKGIAL